MRVMEVGVQKFAYKLGANWRSTGGRELEWMKICSNIKGKIGALPNSDEKDLLWHSYSFLVAVGKAWRNSTMHPKKTYTQEECENIHFAVSLFMNDLAKRV